MRAEFSPLHIPVFFKRVYLFQWNHFIRKTTWRHYAPGRTHSKEMVLLYSCRESWTELVTINEHALLAV